LHTLTADLQALVAARKQLKADLFAWQGTVSAVGFDGEPCAGAITLRGCVFFPEVQISPNIPPGPRHSV